MEENISIKQAPSSLNELFVKRQMLQLIGQNVRTFDANNQMVCFARKKALKLREEITFWKDESASEERFHIKARNVIDIGATYDIFTPGNTLVASLKREGLASTFVSDQWLILGPNGDQWGRVAEESDMLGVLRRYVDLVSLVLPQTYKIYWGIDLVGTMEQNRNPFTMRFKVHYGPAATALGDTLKIALPSMLAILEGRQ